MTPHGRGYLFGLCGAVFFGAMSFLVHAAEGELPPQELAFVRCAFSALALLPFAWAKLPLAFKRGSGWLWLRSIAGGLSIVCFFWTLQGTTVGNSRVLAEIAPLFVLGLGWKFLGEKLGRRELFAVGLILTGALSLNAGNAGPMPLKVFLIGLFGAFAAGWAHFALRQAAAEFSPSLVVLMLSLVGAVISTLAPSEPWRMPGSTKGVLLALSVAVAGLCGQLLMTRSFVYLSAAVANAIARTSLLWAVACQIAFLGDWPSAIEWGCYGLVLAGALLLQRGADRLPHR